MPPIDGASQARIDTFTSNRVHLQGFAIMRIAKLVVGIVILFTACSRVTLAQQPQQFTKADVDRWMKECSNWGRWGKDDELGAVNFITPETRKAAAALVTEGVSVSLAHDVEKERALDNPSPFGHAMLPMQAPYNMFRSDTYTISYHGFCHSHLDALCHMGDEGKMYNGFSLDEVTAKGGAKLSIIKLKNGIFTRGVLVDIPQIKGVPFLEPETPILPADLDAWERKAGIKVGPGDVLFIRTGRWARRAVVGPWNIATSTAGLHATCGKWLHDRSVAVIGSDAILDVMPSGIPDVLQPMHQLTLVAMGMNIFDNLDLEAVSAAAAARNRWAFLLTTAPMAIPGGTGSPLNPIATF
jgi:kynurenine formamidase